MVLGHDVGHDVCDNRPSLVTTGTKTAETERKNRTENKTEITIQQCTTMSFTPTENKGDVDIYHPAVWYGKLSNRYHVLSLNSVSRYENHIILQILNPFPTYYFLCFESSYMRVCQDIP